MGSIVGLNDNVSLSLREMAYVDTPVNIVETHVNEFMRPLEKYYLSEAILSYNRQNAVFARIRKR